MQHKLTCSAISILNKIFFNLDCFYAYRHQSVLRADEDEHNNALPEAYR